MVASFALTLGVARSAAAQACHLRVSPESQLGWTASTRFEAARYANRRYSGRYEGVMLGAGFGMPWVSASLTLPAYHLVRNGLETRGLGDMSLEGRVVPLRGRVLSLGAVATATLPTGSANDELGMGHVMAGLAGLAQTRIDFVSLEATFGFGQSLASEASGGHARHALGLSPLVAPMNRSELQGSFAVTLAASERVSTRLAAVVALPTTASSSSGGAARGASVFGVDWYRGPLRLGLEAALPILGDPFQGKTALEVAVRF